MALRVQLRLSQRREAQFLSSLAPMPCRVAIWNRHPNLDDRHLECLGVGDVTPIGEELASKERHPVAVSLAPLDRSRGRNLKQIVALRNVPEPLQLKAVEKRRPMHDVLELLCVIGCWQRRCR